METAIEMTQLKKQFGNKAVLNDLNLTVPFGSIYGFVGENGAGKTTTMKILLGLLAADQGEVFINGQAVIFGSSQTNQQVGFLPDVPQFYGYLSAFEYLQLCGEVAGLSKKENQLRIPPLLAKVGLAVDHQRISGFSRGMKQRLGLAQALLNQPKILICDEPTSALDPLGRKEVLEILSNLRGETTVLFSTHILTDVEAICDHVAILDQGQIKLSGKLTELKQQHQSDYYQLAFADDQILEQLYQASPFTFTKSGNKLKLPTKDANQTGIQLLTYLAEKKWIPREFNLVSPSLEDLFMEVIGS